MKRPLYCRVSTLITISITLFACNTQGVPSRIQPNAIEGIMDLRDWDFAKDGPVDLSGEYEFYWQQHFLPEDFTKFDLPKKSGFIKVPRSWNGYELNGKKLSGTGYATYRLTVLLKDNLQALALKFLDMGTAYTVFANGEKILSVGKIGTTQETTVPRYFPQVVDIPANFNQIEFIFLISNFHHKKGGPWEVIRIGTKEQVNKLRERRLAFDLILFGGILIMGLYHIVLFGLSKNDRSFIYFGLFCILIAFRLLTTVERYLIHIFIDLNWELFVKIEYLSVYLSLPVFALFLCSIFPLDFHKTSSRFVLAVSLFFSSIVFISPVRVFSHTILTYHLFIVLCFVYGTYVLIRAAILKREGSLIILIGFLFLSLTAINDILDINEIIQTGHFVQLGLFVFIFSQAFLLSFRYSNAFKTIDLQRKELGKTNIEYKNEINERKRAVEALHESEEDYRTLVEDIPGLTFRLSSLGFIQYASPNAQEILGYSPEDLIGHHLKKTTPSKEIPKALEVLKRVLSGEIIKNFQINQLDSRGHVVPMEIHAATVKKDGKVISIQGIMIDITERKQMEKELRHAQKMKAIGVLAGGIAHDFNNILASIMGNSEIGLSEVTEDSPISDRFNSIIRRSEQGAKLVSQLLAFSRKQILDVQPINLNAVIDESLEFLHRVIGENIQLDKSLDAVLATVEADSTAISQIITNLCVNARDAMPHGGTLIISTKNISLDEDYCTRHAWANPGEYVLLMVSDTGEGMDEETIKHIFDPFFTMKGIGEGTGLGLSMVFGLMKQHKGHIDCKSEVGNGTRFELFFPTIASEPEQIMDKAKSEGMTYSGKETILLVEDDMDVLDVIRKVLEQHGYKVLVAGNGIDALELYKNKRDIIDLVITDIVLPKIGGIELYHSVCGIDQSKKFLFLSGYTGSGSYQKFELKPEMDFLQKPFRTTDLATKVRGILDR